MIIRLGGDVFFNVNVRKSPHRKAMEISAPHVGPRPTVGRKYLFFDVAHTDSAFLDTDVRFIHGVFRRFDGCPRRFYIFSARESRTSGNRSSSRNISPLYP